jgi:hypothetical protein
MEDIYMMQINPEWSFEEDLDLLSDDYYPGGITTGLSEINRLQRGVN